MCHNPVFLHAISLTVPSSTESAALNPFDDEDDEEETPAQQPNSSPANVKKEEVVAKMLVNRTHLLLFCSRSLHIYFPSQCCRLMPCCLLFAFIFLQFLLSDGCIFFCMVAQCRSCVNKQFLSILVMSYASVQSDHFWSVPKIWKNIHYRLGQFEKWLFNTSNS